MRRVLPLLLLLPLFGAACDLPQRVAVDPSGTQRLSLVGERGVQGTVARTVQWQGRTLPKGTKVRIDETWLMRKDGKQPAGYRVPGLYDPTQRSEGLTLPRHAVDTYFAAVPLDGAGSPIPVPARHFERAP